MNNTQSSPSLRIGLTQWHANRDLDANLACALQVIQQAAEDGAQIVCLPENGLFLGSNAEMRAAALSVDSQAIDALREAARQAGVPVVLGGFKNKSAEGRIHNTALVIDRSGGIAGQYDKIHLFDASVAGQSFEASSVELRGTEPVMLSVEGVSIGLTICYDVRFPELYRQLALAGAEAFLVPSAFTFTTGQAHWEVLLRARAIENSAYLVAPATVRGTHADDDAFQTWGHAMAVDPWGHIMADLQDRTLASTVITLDLQKLRDIRAKLPVLRGVQRDACRQSPRIVTLS